MSQLQEAYVHKLPKITDERKKERWKKDLLEGLSPLLTNIENGLEARKVRYDKYRK